MFVPSILFCGALVHLWLKMASVINAVVLWEKEIIAPRFNSSCCGGTLFPLVLVDLNGPFPSCCLSRFRTESWCSTIVREISLICIRIRNLFPFELLCTRTRFETEACSNSKMGYLWIGFGETLFCLLRSGAN